MDNKASKLREVREKNCVTRHQLAEVSGVPYRTILSYELGARKLLNFRTIYALSIALECNLFDIAD